MMESCNPLKIVMTGSMILMMDASQDADLDLDKDLTVFQIRMGHWGIANKPSFYLIRLLCNTKFSISMYLRMRIDLTLQIYRRTLVLSTHQLLTPSDMINSTLYILLIQTLFKLCFLPTLSYYLQTQFNLFPLMMADRTVNTCLILCSLNARISSALSAMTLTLYSKKVFARNALTVGILKVLLLANRLQ